MRIIKPTKMALLQRTLSVGDQHKFIVSPLVFFSLSTGEVLIENMQWQKVAVSLGSEALDISLPKSTGEFLVAGTAYPENEQQECMQVSACVGKVQKELSVFGERKWSGSWLMGYDIDAMSPVMATALTWENAYGAPEYKMNPLGTGFTYTLNLPKVEQAQQRINKPKKKGEPASFLPIPIHWPQRTQYHGNYKNKWFEQYFPGFAPDTDPRLFNAAPENQQNATYWQGDEGFCLRGMHPCGEQICGQLPGISPRCFVITDDIFQEVKLVLDTVFLFADHDLGALIYRGHVPVEDSESRKVSDVVLGYENTDDIARTLEHYKSVHQLRVDPTTAAANVLNEAQLTPELSLEAQQTKKQKLAEQQAKKRQALKEQQYQQLQTMPAEMQIDFDALPDPELTPFDQLLDEDIQVGNIDLASVLSEIDKQVEQQKGKADKALTELTDQVGANTRQPTEKVNAQQALENYNCLLIPEALAGFSDSLSPQEREQLGEQSLKLKQMNIKANTQYASDVSDALIACLIADLNRNAPIKAKDLSGLQLHGQVFEGINFEQTLFTHAKLTQCVFKQCDFTQCVFDYATLDQCQFEACNLNQGYFAHIQASATQFVDCQIQTSQWLDAHTRNVKFVKSSLNDAMFRQCELTKSEFQHGSLHKALFYDCLLADADFRQCEFMQTTFVDCRLSVSRWYSCTFMRTVYQGCDLCLSSFVYCTAVKLVYSIGSILVRSNFVNTTLEQSNLRTSKAKGMRIIDSTFNSCDLALSDLSQSKIAHANLARSIFADVDFSDAQLSETVCFQSRFRSANFTQSTLLKLNLLDADLTNAHFENSEFEQCINLSKVALRDQSRRLTQAERA